jgi:class 3 adenylate cyclase
MTEIEWREMVSEITSRNLEAGREAIRRHAWREAFDLLTEADENSPLPPEDLEALGAAGWWVARLDASIAARERAFELYLEAGEVRRAATVAMAVAKDHFGKGAGSVGAAWVKRADQLLADQPECVEQGWLKRLHGVMAFEGTKDFPTALEQAGEGLDVATRFRDRDLMATCLHDQGRALVALGRGEEGWSLIDEATVAAVAGELTPYTTAVVYCNTITACAQIADVRRAAEWSDAAKRWCERQSIAGFPGMCRVYRAEIMAMRGRWIEAESEARAACEELKGFNVGYAAEAHYELGEIRLFIGDLPAAEEAFKQGHRLGRDPQPGLALLRLRQGNIDGAAHAIGHALEETSIDLERAELLPARVEIALARDQYDEASAAAEELETIAERFGSDVFQAESLRARGMLELHRGDESEAVKTLRGAWRLWSAAEAPYEAARTRVLIGKALSACGDDDSARLEFEAAASVFEEIGASLDLRETLDLIGDAAVHVVPGTSKATRTFLFTDIVGSTSLVEAVGDDAWHDLVRWHDQTLRTLFAAHSGQEVDHAGDGFFVAFEHPSAAIDCAVAIQRKLGEHRRAHGFAPRVRIGVHETEATRSGVGYRGKGVHEAARIASVADGEEIVASEETGRRWARRSTLSEPREVVLKGLDRPMKVVSIDWRSS